MMEALRESWETGWQASKPHAQFNKADRRDILGG